MSRNKRKTAVILDGETVETENSLLGRLHTRIEELEAQQEAEKQARQERKEQRRQQKPSERFVAALNRASRKVHSAVMGLLSNLRLSLVLRVALYASGQLLRTTLPMLLAVSVAFFAAQGPMLNQAIDRVLAEQPAQTGAYSAEQLTSQPFSAVYVLETPLEDDLRGWPGRIGLFFSEIRQGPRVLLYENTILGGTVFVWELGELLRVLSVLLWTLLAFELLRVGYFVRHRKRLNQKVLKPITDMAETAATLSANNLSDRISVEGTKNELKDLALVINGGKTISGLPAGSFLNMARVQVGGVSLLSVICLVIFVLCAWMFRNSKSARHLLLSGDNQIAAKKRGINTNRLRVGVMAMSGLMCGIGAALTLSNLTSADTTTGSDYAMSVIGAVVIGGTKMGGGAGSMWGSLIGIALVTVIQNGLVFLGLQSGWRSLFIGVTMLIAIAIDTVVEKRALRRRGKQ